MVLLGAAAAIAVTGDGWRGQVFGLTISLRSAWRLAGFAALSFAVRAALIRHRPARLADAGNAAHRVIAGALLAAGLFGWWAHLSPYAGGADSYGYVSTAERIRTGMLVQREPIADLLPYPNAIDAATPLGYVPTARAPNSSVPAYPLGLPALMSIASTLAGARAAFFVTPVMGLLLVGVCCWWLFSRTRDVTLSLAAGAAVALHPVVFTYAIQPMSDVPAAACFLLAMALLTSGGSSVAAGIAASVSFLIRPALLPGAAALAIIPLLSPPRRLPRIVSFVVIIGLGLALQLWSQWHLYGHPLANGYGPASELFSLHFLPGNARSYGYWSVRIHGLVFSIGLAIAALKLGSLNERVRLAVPLLVAAAPYSVYRTYDHWETLRFLLPLLVAATMAAVAGLFFIGRRVPRAGPWVALALVIAVTAAWVSWLSRERVFERWVSEERFARAGELVSRVTPPDAVVLASLHSGSLRYYAHRPTLDWAKIPPGQLDATVAALEGNGRAVFVMIDGSEERTAFEARHGNVTESQRWLPSGQVRDIRLYEVSR